MKVLPEQMARAVTIVALQSLPETADIQLRLEDIRCVPVYSEEYEKLVVFTGCETVIGSLLFCCVLYRDSTGKSWDRARVTVIRGIDRTGSAIPSSEFTLHYSPAASDQQE